MIFDIRWFDIRWFSALADLAFPDSAFTDSSFANCIKFDIVAHNWVPPSFPVNGTVVENHHR